NMAALMTLSQLGFICHVNLLNPHCYVCNTWKLDPGNTGRISAGEAAQFLKKSGFGDLADSERKGYLDKRGFFIALRLVASAQGGNDISLNNLNQALAAPKFKDTNSPLLTASTTSPDEKGKFEGIFESLAPVNGLLSGDKVKPVLINSKLPLDILGKIWDLSDVDKDGRLDKEEFIVAMHLVYRTMEKEPVPSTLPVSLIPPSKGKRLRLRCQGLFAADLNEFFCSFVRLLQPVVNWVVPVKTDTDNDGLVTGTEVIEIFMHSNLSQTMLAQIWGLADTKQTGKLTQEQFSLAMYLIQQKVTKDVEPPSSLTPDMIPPSERTAASAAGPVSTEESTSTTASDFYKFFILFLSSESHIFKCAELKSFLNQINSLKTHLDLIENVLV
uniref:Epidermal growth factor receptor pathway substrate 15 like 1 n=1 Tax=Sphaeramia orbicularis TaxID=375764 RepID=A0A673BMX0_9TELE